MLIYIIVLLLIFFLLWMSHRKRSQQYQYKNIQTQHFRALSELTNCETIFSNNSALQRSILDIIPEEPEDESTADIELEACNKTTTLEISETVNHSLESHHPDAHKNSDCVANFQSEEKNREISECYQNPHTFELMFSSTEPFEMQKSVHQKDSMYGFSSCTPLSADYSENSQASKLKQSQGKYVFEDSDYLSSPTSPHGVDTNPVVLADYHSPFSASQISGIYPSSCAIGLADHYAPEQSNYDVVNNDQSQKKKHRHRRKRKKSPTVNHSGDSGIASLSPSRGNTPKREFLTQTEAYTSFVNPMQATFSETRLHSKSRLQRRITSPECMSHSTERFRSKHSSIAPRHLDSSYVPRGLTNTRAVQSATSDTCQDSSSAILNSSKDNKSATNFLAQMEPCDYFTSPLPASTSETRMFCSKKVLPQVISLISANKSIHLQFPFLIA